MAILDLLIVLVERFGLILAVAFLIMSLGAIRDIDLRPTTRRNTLLLTLLFGAMGILGTYSGNMVQASVANLRAMSVITAGLVGGPMVGAGAGFIAGLHRNLIDLSGFSALPCGMATFLEGTVAGFLSVRLRDPLDWKVAAALAFFGEIFHMILVLMLARPFAQALSLIQVIGIPMVVINTLGAALFVQTFTVLSHYREKRESSQTQQILAIAGQTVGHLRHGLSRETAEAVAHIIYDRIRVASVAVTDVSRVLAHVGDNVCHHMPGERVRTAATRLALQTGEPAFVRDPKAIGCGEKTCPFISGIIVPLRKGGAIVGCLKFYGTRGNDLDAVRYELAKGLADLFSTQLELEDIQIKERLLAREEIRRLQAQINPHFLFNALNTIASFCRTNSGRARDLLQDLALFMRLNLHGKDGFVPLEKEMEHVRSYLAIEQARFGERIRAELDMDEDARDWPIPAFLIQPLVENGIKHGLAGREQGGKVTVQARVREGELHVVVEDDGVGMPRVKALSLLEMDGEGPCIGVANCNRRLRQIYGAEYGLQIESRPGGGTLVALRIPHIEMEAAA